jgi:predicted MFS family arabinose efflux permease
VVGLPVYLSAELEWSHTQVGAFMAVWVILYGIIQAFAPGLVRRQVNHAPNGHTARNWVLYLMLITVFIASLVDSSWGAWILLAGLIVFGAVFAINSSVHSYLILAYSRHEHVTVDVGFYYMANAAGRLVGTLMSGICYQVYGIAGCLWLAAMFLMISLFFSNKLVNIQVASD